MLIQDVWVEIAVTDAIVQKVGSDNLLLCFATAPPTTEDFFIIDHSDQTRQDAITGSSLYAKRETYDVEITVTEL